MQTNYRLLVRRLLDDRAGATAIEYGLIVALIAISMIVAAQGVGNELSTTMNTAKDGMATGNGAA